LNPRLAHQQALKNEEAVSSENYPTDNANGSLELAEREAPSRGELLLTLWRERRFIAKALAIGFLLSAIVSLLIPPKYEATTRMMPPEKQSLGGLAGILAAATSGADDKAGSLVGGLMSDAMGVKSSGALYVGVLRSRTVQDTIINRFDLRKVYRVRLQNDARDQLADYTDVNEDRKSGIISITVTDKLPQRAMAIARAYPETLNSLTAQLNTSAAHRERVFVEERLKTVKQELDTAAKDLGEFSSKNLTLDVKEQGKAMVEGAATLEGELIAAQSQLSGMEQIYTENNVRVRSLKARVGELKRQLSALQGVNPVTGRSDPNGSDEFGVSLTKLPILGTTYYDLFRRLKIEETVFEILTKQYELAKIEEAKELPTIKVLDEATLPETKSSPKRTLITIVGAFLATLLASIYVMTVAQLRSLSITHPTFGLFGLEVREGIASDMRLLRSQAPQLLSKMRARVWPNSKHPTCKQEDQNRS